MNAAVGNRRCSGPAADAKIYKHIGETCFGMPKFCIRPAGSSSPEDGATVRYENTGRPEFLYHGHIHIAG